MSGIDKPNLVQTSLEVNRLKQLQKADFRVAQENIEAKQKEMENRQQTKPVETQKAEKGKIDSEKKEKNQKQRQKERNKGKKDKKSRGNILDVKA